MGTAGRFEIDSCNNASRTDDSEVLMFNAHDVEPSDSFSFVWFEPSEDWKPGEYAVEFYSVDTEVEPVATGRYTVR